ncbi:hypothetical protein BYT27DRAFT_7258026 [Phlegmacium glaucopus]|nr:hypothetical protein BYT27DRAFT_7258026 [Phlegmacium glaucopus]
MDYDPNDDSEDFKASYDTLIDLNGQPYAATSGHQTFTIATPTTSGHQRVPSLPLRKISGRVKFVAEACRFYVATVIIETTIDLAIEGKLFLRVRQTVQDQRHDTISEVASSKMPVYLSIFDLAHVFQFVMAMDAMYAPSGVRWIYGAH